MGLLHMPIIIVLIMQGAYEKRATCTQKCIPNSGVMSNLYGQVPFILTKKKVQFSTCKQGCFTTHIIFSHVSLQGGVMLVSHDEHLIKMACNEVWLCKDKLVHRLEGGLEQYKKAIESELQST